MDISVIIPTYFKNSYNKTLASVIKQNHKSFEVIVVINGGSRKSYYSKDNVHIHEIAKPGLNNARNIGIKLSKGNIIAFIDDDALAPKNWLFSIESSHGKFRAPVIGGKVLPIWPKNRKPKWIKGILLDYLSILDSRTKKPIPVHPLDWLAGTNISFKRCIFDRVLYFDNDLDRKGEILLSSGEVELCKRIRKKGYQILFDPKIVVKHTISPNRLTLNYFLNRAYWQGVSDLLMDKKHLTKGLIDKEFKKKNLEIKFYDFGRKNASETIERLCFYQHSIGYLKSYIESYFL